MNEDAQVNVYDLLVQMTAFHPLFYLMIPTFLIIMTVHFSIGEIRNYLMFRYKSKRNWYRKNALMIAQLAAIFTITVAGIMLIQSLFIFNFANEWSDYALDHNKYYATFLANYPPLLYTVVTVILLWFLLFFLGLLFFLIFLWSRKPILSFMVVFALNLINIAVTLGDLERLSPFFFTNHINIMQYMQQFGLSHQSFPYHIFLYWVLLISITYFIGLFIVNKLDINIEKGDANGSS
jgi:hypothetical protein